jgi:outer membrane murein-binding lipoprotein Lpp
MRTATLTRLVMLVLTATVLAGCASDARRSQGVAWVEEQEAERRRLQAQGFPQYSLD